MGRDGEQQMNDPSTSRSRAPVPLPVVLVFVLVLVLGGAVGLAIYLNRDETTTTEVSPITPPTTPDPAPQTDSSVPTAPFVPPAIAFTPASGGESRYDEDFAATVTAIEPAGPLLTLGFEAVGGPGLRDPLTSCLEVDGPRGPFVSHVVASSLTVADPGHYLGTLTFPTIVPGTYSFRYSCRPDYSPAVVGSAAMELVGVSRYSSEFYATILSVTNSGTGTTVQFAAHGGPGLRDPATSCLEAGSASISPHLSLVDSRTDSVSRFLIGSLTFPDAAGGRFRYSCRPDYTDVEV
jgi:hypothetical protein